MLKKIEKKYAEIIVFTTTVLIAKLAYDLLMKALPTIKSTSSKYYDVMIGMFLTVAVFFPLYDLVHSAIQKQVIGYISNSKKMHKHNLVGMTIAFATLLVILFGLFMKIKFNINIIADAWNALFHLFSAKHKK